MKRTAQWDRVEKTKTQRDEEAKPLKFVAHSGIRGVQIRFSKVRFEPQSSNANTWMSGA